MLCPTTAIVMFGGQRVVSNPYSIYLFTGVGHARNDYELDRELGIGSSGIGHQKKGFLLLIAIRAK